jgi:hypothetical protein
LKEERRIWFFFPARIPKMREAAIEAYNLIKDKRGKKKIQK